jgi:hypothetical protein
MTLSAAGCDSRVASWIRAEVSAVAVGGQGGEVRVSVSEQSGRDGDGRAGGGAAMLEHGVDHGAPGAAVAVDERVDRLELCVGDRRLGQERHVGAGDKRAEAIDCGHDPRVMRRDEHGGVRRGTRSANPHLLGAEPTRIGEILNTHQRFVDGEDCLKESRGSGRSGLSRAVRRMGGGPDVSPLDRLRSSPGQAAQLAGSAEASRLTVAEVTGHAASRGRQRCRSQPERLGDSVSDSAD